MSQIKTPGKIVLNHQLFNVTETKVRDTVGKFHTHSNVYRDPTVHIYPITDKYELYLISEYRYLYKKKLLESVAGFINEGETPLAAAKRELQEEAGISADHWELLSEFYLAASVIYAKTYIFIAKDLTIGTQNLEDDEEIEVVKVPLQQAVSKVLNGEIHVAATAAGILLLDKLRKEKKL